MVLTVEKIYKPDFKTNIKRPLYATSAPAGFPSPADDYVEKALDLNKHLIKNPTATYFVRVSGESMAEAGILDGDLLIVDRSAEPKNRNIVVAAINGELTVKRLRIRKGTVSLVPANKNFSPIEITEGSNLEIWGVVKHAIHSF